MKRLVIFLAIPLLCCSQSTPAVSKIKTELQTIIDQQMKSWNKGDIEGFMIYYWDSEKLTFQSGNQRLHGWQELILRYKRKYPEGNMGALDFTDIDIRILTNDIAYVLGRYKVFRNDSLSEGLFTIIFQRFPEGWRIINDHSS